MSWLPTARFGSSARAGEVGELANHRVDRPGVIMTKGVFLVSAVKLDSVQQMCSKQLLHYQSRRINFCQATSICHREPDPPVESGCLGQTNGPLSGRGELEPGGRQNNHQGPSGCQPRASESLPNWELISVCPCASLLVAGHSVGRTEPFALFLYLNTMASQLTS